MKKTHIASIAAVAIILIIAIFLLRPPHHMMWGSGSSTADGQAIDYRVHGSANGQPIAAVLKCFHRGGSAQPRFKWTSATGTGSSRIFTVDGIDATKPKDFTLFYNGINGQCQWTTSLGKEEMSLFELDAKPSREALLNLWKDLTAQQNPSKEK